MAWGAVTLPTLLAFNLPPSATFFNQAAALVGWGAWAGVLMLWMRDHVSLPQDERREPAAIGLWTVLLLLAAAVCWSGVRHDLPHGLLLSALGMLAAAGIAFKLGETAVSAGWAEPAFTALCWALVAAAALGTGVALVQVFAPQFADGAWIAGTSSSIAGRAAGNLRQPNHLSSLLLWGLAAWVWLMRQGRQRWPVPEFTAMVGLALLLCFGLVLTGSRTGTLGLLLLAAWGALDRRLAREVRLMLVVAPLAYALMWWGWGIWSQAEHQHFGGEGRFSLQGDISASRFGIWANAWSLVREHPWGGVGWGGFNFAWSLTPFPGRPVAFFDHVHNLPLHFAVELGLPLAALVCLLFGHALWRAVRAGWRVEGEAGVMAASAAVMVLVMALHSQLEYPLWYAYFLLPTGFLWGLCLALGSSSATPTPTSAPPTQAAMNRSLMAMAAAGLVLAMGGCAATLDYLRVSAIFAPPRHAGPLAERIRSGQASWFFNQHGDYAAATNVDGGVPDMRAVRNAAHNLLDTRLMTAWAEALAAQGDLERARHLAQRLREFGRSEAFFEVCDEPLEGQPQPFQCTPPDKPLRFEDFLVP